MYILYSKGSSVTGRHLAEVLGIKGGVKPPQGREDILIRWGGTEKTPQRAGRVVNKRDAIILASNKREALRKMAECHVPIPRTWGINDPGILFPALGRKDHHRKGSDIVLCIQKSDLQRALNAGCTHMTGLIPKAREFRVHVFENEILKISEKILTEPEKYCPWIWNYETGFTFRNPRALLPAVQTQLEAAAKAAVQAIGLDFGAVDICIGDDGHMRVFEVNTGPSLAEKSMGLYARKLAALLGVQVNEEALRALDNLQEEDEEQP